MTRNVPIHYLRPNETVWTPPALACFDTETRADFAGDTEVHQLRLWCARLTDRRPGKHVTPVDAYAHGITGEDLAHQLQAWARQRRGIWVYAHNLHFDLCTSSLIQELTGLGWGVTDFAVDGNVPFVRLARGGRHLTVVDSWSWLPVKLETIGYAVGVTKPALPENDDSDGPWLARCRADVTILSEAILALMGWWDDNKMGRWSITGGASGWNVMRHIRTPRRIVVDPDPAKVGADRRAIHGGRRQLWRAGNLPAGRYAEVDLERAYTTVCARLPLPVERVRRFDSLPLGHPWLDSPRYGVIARVLIETGRARWPVKIGGREWYPVGRFWTTLAGPEITEAARLGYLRQVGPGECHKTGYALRPWALWCLDAQSPGNTDTPDVAKIVLRHWGRSVVGKWAQRGFTKIELGPAPTNGWGFTEAWNHAADVKASIVDFGGTRWQVTAAGDADNAYPAILAFVESHVRVILGRVIDAIGDDAVIACDTDGALIDCADPARIAVAQTQASPLRLREKTAYRQVTVIGPQHLTLDGRRQFAGVPASAHQLPGGDLAALLWPKLAWQIRHGQAGAYVRPAQTYTIAATYAPGWVTADGAVLPPETWASGDGWTGIVDWPYTQYAVDGMRLGPHQNPHLTKVARHKNATRDRKDYPGGTARRGQAGQRSAENAPEGLHGLCAGQA